MENNLFFTCGFQDKDDWIILSNRKLILSTDKEEMILMINNIERKNGGARLEIIPEPEVGISELSVQCDGEKYLFTLTEYDEEGEYIVRIPTLYTLNRGLVDFEGEPFPASSVITDFEFIKKVFIQLLDTGNVSRELME